MAWIDAEQRFMPREERAEVIESLRTLIDAMVAASDTLTGDDLADLSRYMDELERLERVHRGEVDLLYFSYEYFGEVYNVGNDGNWIPCEIALAPEFHREICADMDYVSNVKVNAKVAEAAPRSHAKSSFLSKAFPTRELCYRKRKYIIIISETPDVSTSNLEWLSNQLKHNEKLRADFGPLLDSRKQMNPSDNSSEFTAWYKTHDGKQRLVALVQAVSTGQALRGRNWNGNRPDLIICDDLEGKKNTNTPELRKEMRDWFTQVVMPLGDPAGKKTALVYMGTVVCPDSLLLYVINGRSDFRSRIYRAVIEWPENTEMWERCREIYQDRTNPTSDEAAYEFYLANKDEMERGAVVLWADVQPVFKLMTWKWDNGSKAFNTEYQNNPIDEESAIFVPDNFTYYTYNDVDRGNLDFYGAWDIAYGKSSRADYNAIITLARDKRSGVLYVWDVWMSKCPAHEALDVAYQKICEFGHRAFSVETTGGQVDLHRQLKEKLRQGGRYKTSLKTFQSKRKKEERIESLQPLCEDGTLRFRKGDRLFLEMFEQYPMHNHDDGPDCLQMAVEACSKAPARVVPKPIYL